MKKFEAPAIDVVEFEVQDVITTSETFVPPTTSENQTPYG